MADLTPEQIQEALRTLSVRTINTDKAVDEMKGDVKDLEDAQKDILKRLAALEKKK